MSLQNKQLINAARLALIWLEHIGPTDDALNAQPENYGLDDLREAIINAEMRKTVIPSGTLKELLEWRRREARGENPCP